jgi:RND family efflux transporter MFP subunit
MAKPFRRLFPLFILGSAVLIAIALHRYSPNADKRPKQARQSVLSVDVETIEPRDYQVEVASFGSITPRTEAVLVTQVSGIITQVSPSFRDGGFFEKGQELLTIDDRDYRNAITIARADLANAELALAEEQARVAQAERDWARLGKGKPSSALVLRQPQLLVAQSNLASAKAKLEQAKLDLSRTRVIAPYAGRILNKEVDLGQFIANGSRLAQTYAIDYFEVRLPISLDQQSLLNLPDEFKRGPQLSAQPKVSIKANYGRQSYQWDARLVRSEGALDTNSRQLYVVAQLDNPFGEANQGKPPLKVGQFVSATIEGRVLENVFVIPRISLYQGSQVVILEKGTLQRRDVSVLWHDEQHYVIGDGLKPGEQIVTTPLGQVISGTPATAEGNAS